MAQGNAISQAIGTQRNFRKQEPAVYQRSLKVPTFGAGLHQRTDYDAQLLISSLKDFGAAIVREDDRHQQQVYKDTEALLQGASREDLLKLDAVNLLGKYAPDLKDNSYSRAIADKMKGAALANDTYNNFLTDHAKYNTPEEASSAYEGLMQETYKAAAPNIKNKYAFDKAFYNGQISNSFKAANKQMQDEEEERKKVVWIETDKNFKNLATEALTMKEEDFIPQFSEIVRTMRASNAFTDITKTAACLNSFAEELVRSTGSTSLLDKISDFVVDIDRKGKEHTFGNFVPIKDLAPMAATRQHQIKSEEYRKAYSDAASCKSLEELNQFYDTAKDKYDRVTYETLLKERAGIEHQLSSALKKTNALKVKMYGDTVSNQTLKSNFDSQIDAYLNDYDRDNMGTPVGYVNKPTFNEQGIFKKNVKADEQELIPLIESKIQNILTGEGSQEDKFTSICKMLTFPPCKFYAKSFAEKAVHQLHTLDPEKLSKDEDGNYVLNPQLSALLRVRGEGGNYAEEAFGSNKAVSEIDTLRALQFTEGWNGGIRLYAASADEMKNDPKRKAAYTADAKKIEFSFNNAVGLDGKTTALSPNVTEQMQSRLQDTFVALRFAGKDEDEATKLAQQNIVANNYVFRGALIPKSIFTGFTPSLCKERLDDLVYDYCEKNGYDAASVQWDDKKNKLFITGNGIDKKSFTTSQLRNELLWYHNEKTKDISSAPKEDNIDAVGKTASSFGLTGKNVGEALNKVSNKNIGEAISDGLKAIADRIPDKPKSTTTSGNARTEGIKAKENLKTDKNNSMFSKN